MRAVACLTEPEVRGPLKDDPFFVTHVDGVREFFPVVDFSGDFGVGLLRGTFFGYGVLVGNWVARLLRSVFITQEVWNRYAIFI